jgi:hypothetical protein
VLHLAEAAGLTAGSWYASPATHVGYKLIGAGMPIVAGDGRGLPMAYDELERWTRVGFERGTRSRHGERSGRDLENRRESAAYPPPRRRSAERIPTVGHQRTVLVGAMIFAEGSADGRGVPVIRSRRSAAGTGQQCLSDRVCP